MHQRGSRIKEDRMDDEYACDDCGARTPIEEGYFRADMEMFWC